MDTLSVGEKLPLVISPSPLAPGADLGGADVHTRLSGVADYFVLLSADSDRQAAAIARR